MSKVQEKEATLLSNLSGSEIANELDSRLRDLEKNIAVAREFIKLADESYSELRHKWNLLHEEVRNKQQAQVTEQAAVIDEKTEVKPRNKAHSKTKVKKAAEPDETKSPASTDISAKSEGQANRIKTVNRPKKETQTSAKNTNPVVSEQSSQPYRDPSRRRGNPSARS